MRCSKIFLIFIGLYLSGCTDNNAMMPWYKTPEHYNQVVMTNKHKLAVLLPDCPTLYDQNGEFDPSQNLGCATTSNLGLMIANPKDLLHRRKSPIVYDTQPLSIAIEKYRNDRLPTLIVTSGNFFGDFGGNLGGFGGIGGFGGGGFGGGGFGGVGGFGTSGIGFGGEARGSTGTGF